MNTMQNGARNWRAQVRNIFLGSALLSAGLAVAVPAAQAQGLGHRHEGHVHVAGGNQPLVGAKIYVYAAGTSGYGSATLIETGYTDHHGVIVFNDGDDDIDCSGNPQVYLVALGGNAGQGTNSAIGLSAALGFCSSIPTSYAVDEVTTLASVYALSQFLNSAGTEPGSSSTNATGLNNAVATTQNLVVLGTGLAATSLVSGASGTPPTATINTLADVLDAANSAAPGSAPITSLFTDATPPGGTAPTTTLQAALNIARYPGNNASAIFGLASGDSTYTPVLSAAPNDWTLGINFTGSSGLLDASSDIVNLGIDASGNAWFVSNTSDSTVNSGNGFVAALNPLGVPSAAFTDGGNVDRPNNLAIDGSGKVFATNGGSNTVSGLNSSGASLTGSPYATGGAGLAGPIAVDSSGNVVLAGGHLASKLAPPSYTATLYTVPSGQFLASVAAEGLDSAGDVFLADANNRAMLELFGSSYADGGMMAPDSLRVDPAGNVWVVGGLGAVSEFVKASGYAASNFSPSALSSARASTIDSAGNIWISNLDSNVNVGVVEVSNSGSQVGEYLASGAFAVQYPDGIAIDASGNVWVGGGLGNNIVEIVGAAAPVKTPVIGQPQLP